MREFKFRVWDKKQKSMSERWQTHSLVSDVLAYQLAYIGNRKNPADYLAEENLDRFVFLQFTGFKDIRGAEVYEGDILDVPEEDRERDPDVDPRGYVSFEFGSFVLDNSALWDFAVYTKHEDGRIKDPTDVLEGLEVIGNIYQDRDLLSNWDIKELDGESKS